MNRAEIQALIDAAPDGRIGMHQAGKPMVTVPYGHHVLDGPVEIPCRMTADFSGSVLVVPNGVAAIVVKKEAFGATVRNVTVFGQSQNGAAHAADGIRIEACYAQLIDAFVRFVGVGVHVTSLGGGIPDGVQMANVQVFNCDAGAHLKGGDVNGGCFVGLGIQSCRVGIVDESFLGNTFVGPLLHTIAERAYEGKVAANYSTLVGAYLEADCGIAIGGPHNTLDDKPNATWLGGGGACYAKQGTRVGLNRSRIRFGDSLPNGDELNVTVPHAAAESALTAERKAKTGGALIDGFRLAWTSALKACGFVTYPDAANANGLTRPFGWTTEGHASGFAQARVNALPPSQGNPAGYEIPKPQV